MATPAENLDQMAETFSKIKEFMEVGGFTLGATENDGAPSPPKKAALNTWTNYYRSLINRPGQVVQKFYPVIAQCEAIDAETLKTSKSHLIRQLHSLKGEYDKEYEGLL